MVKPAIKPPAPKKSGLHWIIIGVVAFVAVGAGAAVPMFIFHDDAPKKTASDKTGPHEPKPTLVPFGETMVVNLNNDRLSRFLRVKIILVADDTQEKLVKDIMEKNKPFLKNCLLAYLADQSVKDVAGAANLNRIRRELRDQFNLMLFPDGSEKISDVLFEEFYVQ